MGVPNEIFIFLLSFLIQAINSVLGNKTPITLSQNNGSLMISIAAASPSALPKTQLVQKTPLPSSNKAANPNIPWGTTEKIGDHLYRTYVENDSKMGTPDEIISALNKYRQDNGQASLQKYSQLCPLATKRAVDQQTAGTLDGHKGLEDYMADENHWKELDITSIGENASYGYVLSGTHLIEWVFDSDAEHRSNQLNPQWSLVCPGISGETVDILFGKK